MGNRARMRGCRKDRRTREAAEEYQDAKLEITEVLDRNRDWFAAWALTLTDQEKTQVDKRLIDWCGAVEIALEPVEFKLAGLVSNLETAYDFTGGYVDFLGDDDKLAFDKPVTVSGLIAEIERLDNTPITLVLGDETGKMEE